MCKMCNRLHNLGRRNIHGNNKVEKSNYKEIAQQIINEIGTSENIVSAAHCATRLRLVIKSNEKVNKEAIENIDGVKGVFFASGQLQIIFGTGVVNKVYEEFAQLTGQGEVSKEELKQAASANDNKFKKIIKTLGDVFVPDYTSNSSWRSYDGTLRNL